MRSINRIVGLLLVAACAAIITGQALVRPAVAIADNGDFPKMVGKIGLGPQRGDWDSHKFRGFIYHYIRSDSYRWESGFWSSEFWLVKLARAAQKIFQPGPVFDIRWMGAVHGLLFLLALGIWIFAFEGRWRIWGGLFVVLVWTDVARVQLLDSFYMDTAAAVFLILCVAAGLHAVADRNSRLFPAIMAAAAGLFAFSKSQHAISALLLIPLFTGLAVWTRSRTARVAWIAGLLTILSAAAILIPRDSEEYRSEAVFNLVFLRLARQAPNPAAALAELGLPRSDVAYLGMHNFLPNSPMQNPEYARQFRQRCTHFTVLRYYFRHPLVAAHFLYHDLSAEASSFEPFANRSMDDGFPRNTLAGGFVAWSDIHRFLFGQFPWLIVLLALASLAGTATLFIVSPADRAYAGLLLTIQILAAEEYGFAVLADAAETARHLTIFNVATDIAILMLPWLLWRAYLWNRSRRVAAHTLPGYAVGAGSPAVQGM